MKKIGLVGGISWTSTIDYYRYINEAVNVKCGGLHFAECIIYSVDFNNFRNYNAAHNWDATCNLLTNAAINLKNAGADLLILGANTAHIVAADVEEKVNLPLIDIRTVTAKAIKDHGLTKVGLLGTVFTMEMDFYRSRLRDQGIEVLTPATKNEKEFIEETLVHELGKGIITQKTKLAYIQIANRLIAQGAQGIILGCTEIPLILSQADFQVPVFNTTQLHAYAAVEAAFQ